MITCKLHQCLSRAWYVAEYIIGMWLPIWAQVKIFRDHTSGFIMIIRSAISTGMESSDLLWRNTTSGQNAVWYMNGVMATGVALLPYLDPASGWSIVGVGDFNSDGKTTFSGGTPRPARMPSGT